MHVYQPESRTSTCRLSREQNLDMQIEALKAAGCEKIFSEKLSGCIESRPELDACLSFIRQGDTLIVYKLDRLGRSLRNILMLLDGFRDKGIHFISLQDNISTEGTTSAPKEPPGSSSPTYWEPSPNLNET